MTPRFRIVSAQRRDGTILTACAGVAVLAAFTAAIALRAGAAESRTTLADEGQMPELRSVAWLNSDRLSA
jgi:hypothetical protein